MKNAALHRFSWLLAAATMVLIFAGGLVTSTDSGLSVPDWPLSYGQLMPPMIGGILYEHGHRMIATTVGFLTVVFAVLSLYKEDRRWVRKAAWAAVGLVILQGVLGGVTVLLRLPKLVSIAHACLAQTFFSLVLALVVWTSPYWQKEQPLRVEPANKIPLHRVALALFGVAYVQLIFGAVLRHTGWALPLHIGGAAMVSFIALWTARRIFRDHADRRLLKTLAVTIVSLLLAQLTLGASSYFILIHRFETIPPPLWAPATISLHVMMGALLLGLSLVMALIAYRTRPAHSAPIRTTLGDYFTLTKPGISFMAGITALAGFVLGSHGNVNFFSLIHTCIGTLFAAAGAGSLNMLIERDVDARMRRTQQRPLPSGRLKPGEVLLIGSFLTMGGVLYLSWAVNLLTALLAAATVSIYLYVYTPLKKISELCVSVGAIAGALPPVMGWTAATGRLGWEPMVLFGILFFWQYPHFLSLAWLYKEDYALGGLHMVRPEDRATARSIFWTSIALLVVSLLLTPIGLAGNAYLATALLCGGIMSFASFRFLRNHTRAHARVVFFLSLAYIPLLVLVMVLSGPARIWAS